MFTDPLSVSLLAPHGDPTPQALFREEYHANRNEKAVKTDPAHPQARERSTILRAQILTRVGHFFS